MKNLPNVCFFVLFPPCVVGVATALAVIRFVLGFAQPGKEGGDGFERDALALLLGRVFAGLPSIEALLFDHVLVVQHVEKHPQQI